MYYSMIVDSKLYTNTIGLGCILHGMFYWGGAAQLNCYRMGLYKSRNKGLISVDRKTSLLSHVQYPVPYQSRLQRIYHSQCQDGDYMGCWAEAYWYALTQRMDISSLSSMDSDLEAFSHYPADGSFGALAFQPTP